MPPSRWFAPTALACSLAFPSAAQDPPTNADLDAAARWIERIGPDDARCQAFEHLLTLGEPAAEAAAQALAAMDPAARFERFEACLQLLEALGPAAVVALDDLWSVSEAAEGEVLGRIMDSVLTIAPYAGAAVRAQTERVQTRLHPWIHDTQADLDERRRMAETWFRSVQLGTMNGHALHADTEADDLLVETQGRWASHTFRIETAASLLRCVDDLDAERTHRATVLLLDKIRSELDRGSVSTNSLSYPCGPRSHRVFAASLLFLDPDPAIAAEAWSYLLRHGRRHERWRAVNALRGTAEPPPGYEEALRELALDAGIERDLRAEVVINLGMLTALEPASRAALETLVADDDAGLAARAAAALR